MSPFTLHQAFQMFAAGLCGGVGLVFAATGSPGSAGFAFTLTAMNIGAVLLLNGRPAT